MPTLFDFAAQATQAATDAAQATEIGRAVWRCLAGHALRKLTEPCPTCGR